MRIRKINRNDIRPLIEQAENEGLSFNNSTEEYYGAFINGTLVGMVGLMLYSNKVVLKNDYVLPEFRGQGIFTRLNEHRFKFLQKMGYEVVEANVTDRILPYHLKRGARVIKVYGKCTGVRYENIQENNCIRGDPE